MYGSGPLNSMYPYNHGNIWARRKKPKPNKPIERYKFYRELIEFFYNITLHSYRRMVEPERCLQNKWVHQLRFIFTGLVVAFLLQLLQFECVCTYTPLFFFFVFVIDRIHHRRYVGWMMHWEWERNIIHCIQHCVFFIYFFSSSSSHSAHHFQLQTHMDYCAFTGNCRIDNHRSESMGHLYNQSIADSTVRYIVSHFTCSISGHFDMQQQ